MNIEQINGLDYAELISFGAANLKKHAQETNDLNVFPIPDGDTGDNMLMTMMGGVSACRSPKESLGSQGKAVSGGMLLGARGNSGVILSQFFDGIGAGFKGLDSADMTQVAAAFREGVRHAYNAVMDPTEGTILTVAREASEYAYATPAKNIVEFLDNFLEEARKSLKRTPDLLAVLKKAGVVDSGGAGLIYIVEGMRMAATGESPEDAVSEVSEPHDAAPVSMDLDLFDENSELEFGYCTETLLRLQTKKCDIANFDETIIKDYLQTIGNSIVCVKHGSIVKMHVHTMTPQKVLEFCQKYGEFLTIKIENMSLQHNNVIANEDKPAEAEAETPKERTEFAVVATAAGAGIQEEFRNLGADYIVDGGQSMNPSSEDFLKAFDTVNADTIFVLPNNGNIILAAEQAAKLYEGSDVRVIPTKSIGDGYAVLSMLDLSGSADEIQENMEFAMDGVETASVSLCVRDAEMDGLSLHTGDYIGFIGKDLLACSKDRKEAACGTIDRMNFSDHEIAILIYGQDANESEAEELKAYLESRYRNTEVYLVNGRQDIYSYILIAE